ncbi:MAG: VWA domain-containing protein [Alphaproteobacteria bacterium]|nr:VWA domain-containing protein [Alphaproteobacteria bacterium]
MIPVDIEFARPWAFALLPAPILAWRLLPALPERAAMPVPLGIWMLLDAVSAVGARRDLSTPAGLALRCLGWVALILALSGPFTHGGTLLPPSGRDIVLAVDLSASMSGRTATGQDRGTPPIETARSLVSSLLEGARHDRVALITFASEAYLVAPLTFDHDAVIGMLDEVTIGLPGRRTDLGQAIGLAIRTISDEPATERILLILSDGETNAGDIPVLDAAAMAREKGLAIHAVGFTATEPGDGPPPLQRVTTAVGGSYFLATSDADVGALRAALAGTGPASGRTHTLVNDLAWAPLLLALVTVCLVAWREARDP